MNEIEKWLPMAEYENNYTVCSDGRILNNKGKFLVGYLSNTGYQRMLLCKEGVKIKRTVHRIVAMTFLPNPENLPQVNHIDGNKLNNYASNLEWCDSFRNMRHAHENGLMRLPKGSDHVKARPIYNPNTREFFESIKALAEYLGTSYSFVHFNITGRTKINKTGFIIVPKDFVPPDTELVFQV